jgi:hypothetical protein
VKLRSSTPEPTEARIVPPLTHDHPHAVVAKRSFWVAYWMHPNGFISPGRTLIREGDLADDRSKVVRDHRSSFRRPTPADAVRKATTP